jgi:hypothetical protein
LPLISDRLTLSSQSLSLTSHVTSRHTLHSRFVASHCTLDAFLCPSHVSSLRKGRDSSFEGTGPRALQTSTAVDSCTVQPVQLRYKAVVTGAECQTFVRRVTVVRVRAGEGEAPCSVVDGSTETLHTPVGVSSGHGRWSAGRDSGVAMRGAPHMNRIENRTECRATQIPRLCQGRQRRPSGRVLSSR